MNPFPRRAEIASYPTSKIAALVAAEFFQAARISEFPAQVHEHFKQARFLMGVLETIPLKDDVAQDLAPVYRRCIESNLMIADRVSPTTVQIMADELSDIFRKTAERLADA